MSLVIDERVAGDGATVLVVAGEVDMTTVQPLRTAIVEVLDRGAPELVVDLDAVTFLDSTGISVLVLGRRTATGTGARYRVVNARDMVARVLEVTGVRDFLSEPAGAPAQTPPGGSPGSGAR
jgi:anti-anti-sigma factor